MKLYKKIANIFFDKDSWISGSISGLFFFFFWVIGGYIFITSINPWYKTIFLILLAVFLYILCGIVDRAVFKKLGRKSPKA